MGDVNVIPLLDEGLGNSACLLDLDDGDEGGPDDWADTTGTPLETGR